ncbi:MAG: inverse autotransporter beta domain-containing protein [Candidatus Omnitrophota bacterium]
MSNKSIFAAVITVFVLFITSVSFASQASTTSTNQSEIKPYWFLDAPKEWPAQVMPGMRGGTEKLKSYIDNLIPVFGTKDIILFADYKSVMGARGSNEENIGIGLRDLLFDEKLILGGNFFYDTRYTENKIRHHQLAFGLEGLTKWVDVRSNFYFPISGRQMLSGDTTYLFGSKSLDVQNTYEEPLTGIDYEAGVLIPCLSDYVETRAFLGGYNYFPGIGKGLNGIKARFEVRPIKALTVNVEMKSDNYGAPQYFVEGFMTIPLDTMNVFKIKNPFTEFGKYFSYKKGIRSLRERMVDRVVRDIDVTAKSTPTVRSKAHDLTYVDNTYYSGYSNGSLDRPYTTIADGITNATGDHWIYVKGTGTNYAGNLNLPSNYVLWGSAYNGGFQNLGVSGVYPVISGGTQCLTINNNNTVMGMKMQSATDNGIKFTAGTTLTGTIKHNICNSNGNNGIDLDSNTATITSFTIDSNTLNSNTSNGINFGGNSGTMRNVTISNNMIDSNGDDAIRMWANSGTLTGFLISNNTCSNAGLHHGIDMDGNGGTMSNFTFLRNVITGNNRDGIMMKGGTITGINFGDGTAGGYNSIYNNNQAAGSYYDFENQTGNAVYAQYNWWGQATGPGAGQIYNSATSSTNSSNYLSSNPN